MDTVNETLGKIVNPWTCLIYVVLLLFYGELRSLLGGLGRVASGLTDFAYKDFKLSIQDRQALATELVEHAPSDEHADKNVIRRQQRLAEKIQSSDISEDDLLTFLELFSAASTVLVDKGSRYSGALYRLQDSGAVNASGFSVAVPSRRTLQEWTLTPEGKRLRMLLARDNGERRPQA